MYTVGLDVDTTFHRVSFSTVTYFIIIWLYAGNFKAAVRPPGASPVGTIVSSGRQKAVFGFLPTVNNQQVTSFRRTFSIMKAFTGEEEKFDFDAHPLSDHLCKHRKPESDKEFGYYLAGLIEGDGCIHPRQIVITFHSNDTAAAYYVKKRIGFGSVRVVPSVRVVRYIASSAEGRGRIYALINGKFVGTKKTEQLSAGSYDAQFGAPVITPVGFDQLSNH